MEKKLYFKNLDASRFYAFLLVLLAHCFVSTDPVVLNNPSFIAIQQWGKVGLLGLEYFFVLSSFLITYLVLRENEQTNDFKAINFMIRRTLRVWPLYFLIVFIGFICVYAATGLGYQISSLPPWPFLVFFIVNFHIINHGTEFLFFIAFLWSISVEEQFYLFWSFVMKFLRKRLHLISWLMIISSLIFRILNQDNDQTMFFHTISALGNFGVGALLARAMFHNHEWLKHIAEFSRIQVAGMYLIFFASVIFFHQLMEFSVFRILSRVYFSLLFAFIIIDQCVGKHRLFDLGNNKLTSYLGKISYGLYCFHGVVITALVLILRNSDFQQNIVMSFFVFPIMIVIVSAVLSHFSYQYFELFFLRKKRHFYTFQP